VDALLRITLNNMAQGYTRMWQKARFG